MFRITIHSERPARLYLVVFLLFICLPGFAYSSYCLWRAYCIRCELQRAAVRGASGLIYSVPVLPGDPQLTDEQLARSLPDDVGHLILDDQLIGPHTLGRLTQLKSLKVLSISGEMPPAGFADAVGRSTVIRLRLKPAQVDRRGLDELAMIRRLDSFSLKLLKRPGEDVAVALSQIAALTDLDLQFEVSDAEVKQVAALPQLRSFVVAGGDRLTSAAGASLSRMRKLEGLACPRCPRLDDGFAKGLWSTNSLLMGLDLEGCSVSDEGASWLAKLPKLQRLNLKANPISDRGLAALAESRSLEEIELTPAYEKVKFTMKGIEKLRQRRPEIVIRMVE